MSENHYCVIDYGIGNPVSGHRKPLNMLLSRVTECRQLDDPDLILCVTGWFFPGQ